jgi:hypothetical protein
VIVGGGAYKTLYDKNQQKWKYYIYFHGGNYPLELLILIKSPSIITEVLFSNGRTQRNSKISHVYMSIERKLVKKQRQS